MLFCPRIRPWWRGNLSGSTFSCSESGVWFLLFLRDSITVRDPISQPHCRGWASVLHLNFRVCCSNRRLSHICRAGNAIPSCLIPNHPPTLPQRGEWELELHQPERDSLLAEGLNLSGRKQLKGPPNALPAVRHTSFYREVIARLMKWLCPCSLLGKEQKHVAET